MSPDHQPYACCGAATNGVTQSSPRGAVGQPLASVVHPPDVLARTSWRVPWRRGHPPTVIHYEHRIRVVYVHCDTWFCRRTWINAICPGLDRLHARQAMNCPQQSARPREATRTPPAAHETASERPQPHDANAATRNTTRSTTEYRKRTCKARVRACGNGEHAFAQPLMLRVTSATTQETQARAQRAREHQQTRHY